MASKRTNAVSLKGELDLDFSTGVGTLTEITKEGEDVFDFFKILSEFSGKNVTVSIKEENDLPTIDLD